MEVLISIGIMAIGMVSIASLLPVGGIYVDRANVEERKAELGQNAFREFQIRGMGNMNNWVAYNASGSQWISYVSPPLAPAYQPPIAIDPLMVAAGHNASPPQDATVDNFPAIGAGGPLMKRLTVAQAGAFGSTVSGPPAYSTYTPNKALAEAIFTLTGDLVVTQPDDRTLPATSPSVADVPEAAFHRPYVGGYTWLATLTPGEGNKIAPAPMGQYLLSVVIFNRRQLATVPTAGSGQEVMVHAGIRSGSSIIQPPPGTVNIGGGDLALQDTTTQADANLALAKPNSWMMLCRTDTPTHLRIFKWYRIVAAADGDTAGTVDVTLNGPDWVWGSGSSDATYACLFDGAVAVYQRVIHLDGPSVWNQ